MPAIALPLRRVLLVVLASALGLSACGGGAGSGSNAAQYPLQFALSNLYLRGATQTASVSGTADVSGTSQPVTGSATIVQSPARLTTFAGKPAYLVTTTTTGTAWVAGQTVPISSTTQDYFSLTFAPLASSSDGSACTVQGSGAYPATVSAGQSGTVAAFTCASAANDPAGSASLTFTTAPGGSGASVLFTLNEQLTDPLGVPIGRLQVQYALDSAGNIALVYRLQLLVLGGIPMTLTFSTQSSG